MRYIENLGQQQEHTEQAGKYQAHASAASSEDSKGMGFMGGPDPQMLVR
jgi:hypothetical protein